MAKGRLGVCEECHEEKRSIRKNSKTGKDICFGCYVTASSEVCCKCLKLRPVHTRNEEGKPICPQCYREARTHEECFLCSKMRPVATRSASGRPICSGCYRHFVKFHAGEDIGDF